MSLRRALYLFICSMTINSTQLRGWKTQKKTKLEEETIWSELSPSCLKICPDAKARREKAPGRNQRVVGIPLKRVKIGYGWIEEHGLEKLKTSKDPIWATSPLGRGIKEIQIWGRQVASNSLACSNAVASFSAELTVQSCEECVWGKKSFPHNKIRACAIAEV